MRVRRRGPPGRLAWLSCLALATLLLACVPACAGPFALDPASGAHDVRGHSEVLRDPGGDWGLADVLARESLFRPADTLVPDPWVSAFSPGTLWYRLQPRSDSPGAWFLDGSPEIDRGEAILVRADGRVLRATWGMMVPAAGHTPLLPNNMALLPDGALTDGTLYVRLSGREEHDSRFGLRPAVWEAAAGRARAEAGLVPRLVLGGMVGGLGLFHLVLAAMLRERLYLHYAAAAIAFVTYVAADCQLAWHWLWPAVPIAYDVAVDALFCLYLALTLGFARGFLDPGGLRPRRWRVAWAAWWMVAAFQAVCSLDPNLLDQSELAPLLNSGTAAALFAAILACGLAPLRERQVGAGAYMTAFCGTTLGMLVEQLGDYEVIAQTPWTNTAAALGVAWEAMFLAVALGQRMMLLRVERDRLSTMALTDGLTGVANRRAFDQRFDEEWRRAVRGGTPLSVVMFDVDCFKSYNDTYGHAAGDLVLSRVAAAAALSLERAEDFLARYGGEEFVAVLPGVGAEEGAALAEKVRLAVQALQLEHSGSASGCVTLSGGVASATPEPVTRGSELPAIELLRAADAALYEAKRGGRNQVRVACRATRSGAEQAGVGPDLPMDRIVWKPLL